MVYSGGKNDSLTSIHSMNMKHQRLPRKRIANGLLNSAHTKHLNCYTNKVNIMNECMKSEWKGQCCCSCKFHLQDFHHCSVDSAKIISDSPGCLCNIPKGWICAGEAVENCRYHSGWTEHGMCEMWEGQWPRSSVSFTKEMWRRFIQLCHPDQHSNSIASTEATRWLLENRPWFT